ADDSEGDKATIRGVGIVHPRSPQRTFPSSAPPEATPLHEQRPVRKRRDRMQLNRKLTIILAATTVAAVAVPSAATAAAAPPAGTGQLIQLDSLGGVGSFATEMNE